MQVVIILWYWPLTMFFLYLIYEKRRKISLPPLNLILTQIIF